MEPATNEHRSQLRQAAIKITRIRLALLNLLATESRHMTADEITAALKAREVLADRVTVYRNIDRMIESGMLVATHLPGRAMRVGLCTQPEAPHHHHIVCEKCGRVAETYGCPVLDAKPKLENEIRESCGFNLTSHITQYVGVCPACQHAHADPNTR